MNSEAIQVNYGIGCATILTFCAGVYLLIRLQTFSQNTFRNLILVNSLSLLLCLSCGLAGGWYGQASWINNILSGASVAFISLGPVLGIVLGIILAIRNRSFRLLTLSLLFAVLIIFGVFLTLDLVLGNGR